jgi:cell division protein FtsQ
MSAVVEIPSDVKYLNFLSNVLFGVFLVLLFVVGFQYYLNNKMKNLEAMIVKGDVSHNDARSLRNHVASHLRGNFYSINLRNAKKSFESITWVSQAVVKRVYPNQISVQLTEFKPKAIWGAREDMRLIDSQGVIFEAGVEDDEYEAMPQLIGPEGQGKLMVSMYGNLSEALSPLQTKLKVLELNVRGSWIATLERGAQIELGRGNVNDVIVRANKFSIGAEKMLLKLNKKVVDMEYIDLRHSEGYAMRMHGVTTIDAVTINTTIKKQ